jgi:arabinofuranosyltransferase
MLSLSRPSVRGADRAEASDRVWAERGTLIGGLLVVVVFAVLAYQRRWVSDDGTIVVREVRQILAGMGPNYNPFQRDEVDTSPLWTWLLAGFAFIRGGDIAVDAVALGLVCSVAGMALALAGSMHFQRQRGTTGVLAPVGALVPLAVAGFWDFATSGLETGLSLLWLGLTWWLIVAVDEKSGRSRLITAAVVIGLGALVRPDFAIGTVVFGAALLILARPGRRRGLAYSAIGLALPVGYEIFRAGYYGLTVPMPALAKEAGTSVWARGLAYLNDFTDPYLIWVPLLLICVVLTRLLSRTLIDRRTAVLLGAPVLTGLLLGVYVVKVGGDYMHARMWIPVVFALLLPVLLLPVGRGHRAESVGAALLAVWALVAGVALRAPYQGEEFGPGGLVDERGYEAAAYQDPNPTTTLSRTKDTNLLTQLPTLTANGTTRTIVMSSGVAANGTLWTINMSDAVPDHTAFFYDNMGITDAVMPLNGTVIDVNGLASPLAGHLLLEQRSRPGHEKWLPAAWVLAEYADPAAVAAMKDTQDVTKAQVVAARHALTCGAIKELMDSVNQPMGPSRFWHNLTGSVDRTSLRIPADPFAAERQFC